MYSLFLHFQSAPRHQLPTLLSCTESIISHTAAVRSVNDQRTICQRSGNGLLAMHCRQKSCFESARVMRRWTTRLSCRRVPSNSLRWWRWATWHGGTWSTSACRTSTPRARCALAPDQADQAPQQQLQPADQMIIANIPPALMTKHENVLPACPSVQLSLLCLCSASLGIIKWPQLKLSTVGLTLITC